MKIYKITEASNKYDQDACQERQGKIFQDYWRTYAFSSRRFRRLYGCREREAKKVDCDLRQMFNSQTLLFLIKALNMIKEKSCWNSSSKEGGATKF